MNTRSAGTNHSSSKIGQRVGYVRVSTVDQNEARQLDGVEVDRTFTDHASAKTIHRPQLEELISYVRDGDTVVVHSMDRLARKVVDLRQIVDELTSKGVAVEFVTEHLTFTGDDSPMSNLLLSMMGAVAEFERNNARERQAEGIAKAKTNGVYTGRKKALTPEQVDEIKAVLAERPWTSKAQLAKDYGVSRGTLYNYLKEERK